MNSDRRLWAVWRCTQASWGEASPAAQGGEVLETSRCADSTMHAASRRSQHYLFLRGEKRETLTRRGGSGDTLLSWKFETRRCQRCGAAAGRGVSWGGGGRACILWWPRGGAARSLLVSRPHFATSHQEKLRKASVYNFSTISRMHGVHFYAGTELPGHVLRQREGRGTTSVWRKSLRTVCICLFLPCVFSIL